jgi:hypothetical protein
MDLFVGAVDSHIHACPHINARSVNVLEATRQAAAAGMRGIGLMDNFANSSGMAALAMAELSELNIDVFGGLIMEPPAGGVSVETVRIALSYGYAPEHGARYISMPTHHTRNIARLEGRSPAYVDGCFCVPLSGELPDPLPEILELIAERDVVLNTGLLSPQEAIRLVKEAKRRGVMRTLVPCAGYPLEAIREIASTGAFVEFSFFFLTHATQIGLTHVDEEKHTGISMTLREMVGAIRAASPQQTILSSDLGLFALPPPVEGFREFLVALEESGFSREELRIMSAANPARLFRVPPRGQP